MEKTPSEHIRDGIYDERCYNPYSANASYEMAGEAGQPHRERLIRREAVKNPVRAYCLLNDNDTKDLKEYIASQADKRKLHDVRNWIKEL